MKGECKGRKKEEEEDIKVEPRRRRLKGSKHFTHQNYQIESWGQETERRIEK